MLATCTFTSHQKFEKPKRPIYGILKMQSKTYFEYTPTQFVNSPCAQIMVFSVLSKVDHAQELLAFLNARQSPFLNAIISKSTPELAAL